MKIREIREQKGLSQTELSRILGVAQNTLSQYELGKREPDLDTIHKLADYFEVTTDYLLGRSEIPQGEVFAASNSDPDKDLTDEQRQLLLEYKDFLINKYKKD